MRFQMNSRMRFEWMIVAALGLWMGGATSALAQATPSLSSCQAVLDRYQEGQLAQQARAGTREDLPSYSLTFDQALQLCETFNRQEANRLQMGVSERAAESQERMQLEDSRAQERLQREQEETVRIQSYLSSMFEASGRVGGEG